MKLNIPRRYVIIALVVYALALIATIPASLFTGMINRNLSGITVDGLQGSLWSGRIGQLYVAGTRLQGVEWHLQPWALLLGRLQLGLEYADTQNRLELSLAHSLGGSNQIRGLEGQLQVPWLQGLTPYSIPTFKGLLLFDDVSLGLNGLLPTFASGDIHWRGAAVDMGTPVQLGDILVKLSRAKGQVVAVVSETSGRLDGDARFSLAGNGVYQIQAKLKPTSKGADLARHLALLMQRNPDGSYAYHQQGRLPQR